MIEPPYDPNRDGQFFLSERDHNCRIRAGTDHFTIMDSYHLPPRSGPHDLDTIILYDDTLKLPLLRGEAITYSKRTALESEYQKLMEKFESLWPVHILAKEYPRELLKQIQDLQQEELEYPGSDAED